MAQFEMAAIYSTGLDKTDGNEVLPGRGAVSRHRPPGEGGGGGGWGG